MPNSSVRCNREKAYAEILDRHHSQQLPGRLLFVNHELKITRFHAMLELACQWSNGQVELLFFRQGAELWHSVAAPKIVYNPERDEYEESEENELLAHRPDAFFTLYFPGRPEGRQHSHFLYEADNATMDSNRFARKLRAHFHFVVRQKHLLHIERHYGVPRIRAVITETTTSHQAELLRGSARSFTVTSRAKPSPLFWFTHSGLFEQRQQQAGGTLAPPLYLTHPQHVFSPIWLSPVNDHFHSLLDQ